MKKNRLHYDFQLRMIIIINVERPIRMPPMRYGLTMFALSCLVMTAGFAHAQTPQGAYLGGD